MQDDQEVKIRTRRELGTMKETVWKVLEENTRARNDDRFLILKVLEKQGHNIVLTNEGAVWYIDMETFGDVPAFETITRCRRDIQNNDGHWLPTDPAVLLRRQIREEAIREYYGNDQKMLSDYAELKYGVQ